MTKKDYQLLADAINASISTTPVEHMSSVASVILSIASTLYTNNPRFNCSKFYEACVK